MRSKLALAGVVAGVAAALAPVAPASAQCDPQIVVIGDGGGSGGCSNGCMDTGNAFNAAQQKALGRVVVDYWDYFLCTQ